VHLDDLRRRLADLAATITAVTTLDHLLVRIASAPALVDGAVIATPEPEPGPAPASRSVTKVNTDARSDGFPDTR
jgi:hypothetical protein